MVFIAVAAGGGGAKSLTSMWLPLAIVAVSCCPAGECAGSATGPRRVPSAPLSRPRARRVTPIDCGCGAGACPGRADRTGLAEKLADHGVAFFPKAFSKDECALLIQQFVDNCEVNEVWHS